MSTISVIVPVYNTERYLKRCIDSILSQRFSDFELLLVDDGSTDSSGEICEEYAAKDRRIRVLHQTNQGQAAARNNALDWFFANSNSEYISFVDSDDWVHPDYLECMFKAMRENCSVSICGYRKVRQLPEYVEEDIGKIVVKSFEEYFCTVEEGYDSVSPVARLYSRHLFDDVRFPRGKVCEDLYIIPKVLFSASRLAVVYATRYYYYQSENSTMRQTWTRRRLDEVYASEELIRFMSRQHNPQLKKRAVERYLWVLDTHAKLISSMSNKDRWAENLISKKKKWLLLRHFDCFPISSYRLRYETTFPKLAWLYWTFRGVLGKIERMVRK